MLVTGPPGADGWPYGLVGAVLTTDDDAAPRAAAAAATAFRTPHQPPPATPATDRHLRQTLDRGRAAQVSSTIKKSV
jgi:hypothetical protein